MTSKKLFTVVIPTYNREHLIVECVNSVVSQIENSYEIIVIDDASTDNSVKTINKNFSHLGNFTLIENKHNKGVSFLET